METNPKGKTEKVYSKLYKSNYLEYIFVLFYEI